MEGVSVIDGIIEGDSDGDFDIINEGEKLGFIDGEVGILDGTTVGNGDGI